MRIIVVEGSNNKLCQIVHSFLRHMGHFWEDDNKDKATFQGKSINYSA